MKIINFGSLNVDYVYQVESIVRPGETTAAFAMSTFPGGKGANQSVAMVRAGAVVWHAGLVGRDTEWLRSNLEREGVDVRHIGVSQSIPGGHAIIQVDRHGMNSIVVLGGTNQAIEHNRIREVLKDASPGDWLALQNEINLTSELITAAKKAGMKVCLNPAPFTADVQSFPLADVDLLIVNRIEASCLAGAAEHTPPERVAAALSSALPTCMLCITLGGAGALFHSLETGTIFQPAYQVRPVDTTGAGDTFTGYLLASLSRGMAPTAALELAARAAALSVTRDGAIPSIPARDEVLRATLQPCSQP